MLVQQTLKNTQDGLLVAQTVIRRPNDALIETPESTESFAASRRTGTRT